MTIIQYTCIYKTASYTYLAISKAKRRTHMIFLCPNGTLETSSLTVLQTLKEIKKQKYRYKIIYENY